MSGRSTSERKAVKANIKNPLEVPKQPKTPQYVDIDVPESPDLQGYTIGNRAEYRLYAMDIINAGPRATRTHDLPQIKSLVRQVHQLPNATRY